MDAGGIYPYYTYLYYVRDSHHTSVTCVNIPGFPPQFFVGLSVSGKPGDGAKEGLHY